MTPVLAPMHMGSSCIREVALDMEALVTTHALVSCCMSCSNMRPFEHQQYSLIASTLQDLTLVHTNKVSDNGKMISPIFVSILSSL